MEEDELEDIVKPKQEELALQEKPPGRKTRQTVKIVLPALQVQSGLEQLRGCYTNPPVRLGYYSIFSCLTKVM